MGKLKVGNDETVKTVMMDGTMEKGTNMDSTGIINLTILTNGQIKIAQDSEHGKFWLCAI